MQNALNQGLSQGTQLVNNPAEEQVYHQVRNTQAAKGAHQGNICCIGTTLDTLCILRHCQLPLTRIDYRCILERLVALQFSLQGRPDPDDNLHVRSTECEVDIQTQERLSWE